jgi:hypothetical protein
MHQGVWRSGDIAPLILNLDTSYYAIRSVNHAEGAPAGPGGLLSALVPQVMAVNTVITYTTLECPLTEGVTEGPDVSQGRRLILA